jgi:predicted nuclease with TOPRIM domain
MKIEISNGELLDKLTILEIKLAEIKDKVKLVNIQKEFNTLNPLAKELFDNNDGQLQNHYLELASINSQLWDIEDRIRECEKAKRFDKEFIELARSVYITNDKRSEVKKIINVTTGSNLVEEKSYEEYQN